VGGGLIGSACARHACAREGVRVIIIGQSEPEHRADTDIHRCWHDEGRLFSTREKVWGELTRASVCRFKEIAEKSGVKFHVDSGYLDVVGPSYDGFAEWVEDSNEMQEDHDCPILSPEDLQEIFPFMSLPSEATASYEPPGQGGGYLSPRKLVRAQQKIAKDQGCEVINALATGLVRAGTGWRVETENGDYFHAKTVALCQGTYSGLSFLGKELLPALDLTFTGGGSETENNAFYGHSGKLMYISVDNQVYLKF
jgi:sarcosine oxidase